MKAITKQEVAEAIGNREFPVFVIEAFNECIVESKIKGSNDVKQNDVMDRILAKSGETRTNIFSNNWLDVEEYYRKAGWTVIYNKPAYNAFYDAYFTFK